MYICIWNDYVKTEGKNLDDILWTGCTIVFAFLKCWEFLDSTQHSDVLKTHLTCGVNSLKASSLMHSFKPKFFN